MARLARFTRAYRAVEVPPISLANSGRLDSLLRAGKIYLSLQDAIALALENNIDIEIQRYGPQIADANVLLASAGGFARGVSTSVQGGPNSASAGGVAQTGGIRRRPGEQRHANGGRQHGHHEYGPPIPSLDPMITGSERLGAPDHSAVEQLRHRRQLPDPAGQREQHQTTSSRS